jgi:hypothetical protein
LSKNFIANLASAFVLTAAVSAFAAPDTVQTSAAPATAAAPAAPQAAQPAAQATTQTASAKPAKKQPLPTDIICKPDSGTGSRLGGEKICMTREDWRKHDLY